MFAPVPDNTDLYRTVHRQFVCRDLEGAEYISKGVFSNTKGTDEMSVQVSDTVLACERTADDLLRGDHIRVVAFPAYAARTAEPEQIVERSPEDATDPCDAHGSVIGKKSGAVQRALDRASTVVAG